MEKENNNLIWHKISKLFITFLKIGAFTFGGGYAMIPIVEREVVEKNSWITHEDMIDMIAIAESTPGVIAVNTATFVGYKVGGFWGSLFSTVGIVLPSFVIIGIISLFFEQFKELKLVELAFDGIRIGVIVLILSAAFKLFSKFKTTNPLKKYFNIVLFTAALVLSTIFSINPIYIIIGAAILGLICLPLINKTASND